MENCAGTLAAGGAKGPAAWPIMGVAAAGAGIPAPAPAGVMRPDCLSIARRADGLVVRDEAAGGAEGGGCTCGI